MWKLLIVVAYISQANSLNGIFPESIESRMNRFESIQSRMNRFEIEMRNRMENLEEENLALKNELELIKKMQADRVGFSVYLAGSHYVGSGARVMYQTVITNEGSGFDVATGGFICPVTGLYYFVVTSFSYGDQHLAMQMVKGTVPIATSHADGGGWDQGSNSVIVNCIGGEEVYVKQTNPNGGVMDSEAFAAGNILNSFVGFLISI